MSRKAMQMGAFALLLAAFTAPTLGGWAVVTVTDLPEYATAGTPVKLEWVVRQHGADAQVISGLAASIVATSGSNRVVGAVTGAAGKYTASFAPTAPGEWKITVNSGFGNSNVNLEPMAVVSAGMMQKPRPLTMRGRDLFVAKGCFTCHTSSEFKGAGIEVGGGPTLAAGRLTAEYVSAVLADPTKANKQPNSSFRMPNLNLKPAEIAALTAFVTQSLGKTAAEMQKKN